MKIEVLRAFNLDIGNGVQKLYPGKKCKCPTPFDFDGVYEIPEKLAKERNYYEVLGNFKGFVKIIGEQDGKSSKK